MLLYELVTGNHPFRVSELRGRRTRRSRRIIYKVDPPEALHAPEPVDRDPPRHAAAQDRAETPRDRGSRRPRLIVMRAREGPAAPLQTAGALATDIQLPPRRGGLRAAGRAYRPEVRAPGWGGVIAGCAIVAALLVGAVGFAWQAASRGSARGSSRRSRSSRPACWPRWILRRPAGCSRVTSSRGTSRHSPGPACARARATRSWERSASSGAASTRRTPRAI
jgi:hypothetical protein